MKYIAVVTDLIFGTKITGTAKALSVPLAVARSLDKLRQELTSADVPAVVMVDLNVSGVDPIDAVRTAKAAGARVIAYLSHVQADLAVAARQAGADQVLARSAFVQQLPALLAPLPTEPK